MPVTANWARLLSLVILAAPALGRAEPATLKLAYFSSDRSSTYLNAIEPFVMAVNAAGENIVSIEVHAGGGLGHDPRQQLQLVLDGTADIAFIIPGYTPERFPDNGVIELPGLFRDIREATLTFTRLVETGALRGYEDLVVIGPFAAEPSNIHSHQPAASLDDLAGQRVRVNNPVEAAAVAALGMNPIQAPLAAAANAISAGAMDGTVVAASPLIEFGIARVATNHYLMSIASTPLPLVMSRRSFDALSPEAQAIIHRFSGEWLADAYLSAAVSDNARAIDILSSDPRRHVTHPSLLDQERAETAFASVRRDWLAAEPGRAALLALVESEIEEVRSDP